MELSNAFISKTLKEGFLKEYVVPDGAMNKVLMAVPS